MVCSPLDQFAIYPVNLFPSILFAEADIFQKITIDEVTSKLFGFIYLFYFIEIPVELSLNMQLGLFFGFVFVFSFFWLVAHNLRKPYKDFNIFNIFAVVRNSERFFSTRNLSFTHRFFLVPVTMAYDIIGNSAITKTHLFAVVFYFYFILFLNLFGLPPYCYCVTAQLCVTFMLGFGLFIGANLYGIAKNGLSIFKLFLPAGTSIYLAFLLVPLELISYFFRPLSLSVRLFANMMAGHTLLVVIAGFGWSMLLTVSFFAWGGAIFPTVVCVFLWFLEFGVALIQTYVFTILFCIYISDAIKLH